MQNRLVVLADNAAEVIGSSSHSLDFGAVPVTEGGRVCARACCPARSTSATARIELTRTILCRELIHRGTVVGAALACPRRARGHDPPHSAPELGIGALVASGDAKPPPTSARSACGAGGEQSRGLSGASTSPPPLSRRNRATVRHPQGAPEGPRLRGRRASASRPGHAPARRPPRRYPTGPAPGWPGPTRRRLPGPGFQHR